MPSKKKKELKPVNWTEIEARYIAGEEPRTIAADFEDCSGTKISVKASKKGWVQQKEKIRKEIVDSTVDQLRELEELTISANLKLMRKLNNALDEKDTDLTLTKGSRMDEALSLAMTQGNKLLSQKLAIDAKRLEMDNGDEFDTFTLVIQRPAGHSSPVEVPEDDDD